MIQNRKPKVVCPTIFFHFSFPYGWQLMTFHLGSGLHDLPGFLSLTLDVSSSPRMEVYRDVTQTETRETRIDAYYKTDMNECT